LLVWPFEVAWIEDVEANAGRHGRHVQTDSEPPQFALPRTDFQIAQHPDAHQQAGQAAAQVRHIPDPVVVVGQMAIDGRANVGAAEYEEHKQLDESVLHFVPILKFIRNS
jgi:hypothetical protein